ncbi:MAG TPA: hybrid sensor histidine kinase/response regulator, partial [Cyanothece sp. UBA12306]|nr:hybrid sensor histidine kinase/response regulator [Cyanothece sp. UBA12306]
MLTLKHFLYSVPLCQSCMTLDDILALFKSGQHDVIAVVDENHTPLGIISSRHLLSSLLQQSLTSAPDSTKSISNFQSSKILSTEKSTVKQASSIYTYPSPKRNWQDLLTKLVLLPCDLSLTDFGAYVQDAEKSADPRPTYGVVDQSGKFLGLVDSEEIIQVLLTQKPNLRDKTSCFSVSEPLLQELLEQFPLPVMVQTKQGEIIQKNQSWREQIGNLTLPDNTNVCYLNHQQRRYPLPAQVCAVGNPDVGNSELTSGKYWAESSYLTENLACSQWLQSIPGEFNHNSSFSETPELHSPMSSPPSLVNHDSEQERVWQFVKCPLNTGDLAEETFLVLATDVTQQQRLCQELGAKNADLVQLNRLKDEFLACISHELKSPLTAVVGLSSLLGEQKIGELNSRQVHYAELIYRSGRQLMTLVNDLLDLTRLETGQLKLSFIPLNIKSICQRAYDSIKEKHQLKANSPLSFSLEIEPGLKFILADELRLHQMLVHLLDNALKFSQDQGQVGIKVNRWENWLAFTVWDTGIGIPEESQHLIFQKFQQLENPLTRKFEGTGLGLVLTQRLARAHGGDISFISKAGQGSQFTLLLPPSPDIEVKKNENNSSLIPNPMVLIVEAIPHHIEDLMDKLTQLNYRVVIARTGTEAVEKARQLRPYAIMLNPLLPLLSGWDVLTLLKSDPQTRKIPVFVTASPGNQPLNEPNQANGFLSIPADL